LNFHIISIGKKPSLYDKQFFKFPHIYLNIKYTMIYNLDKIFYFICPKEKLRTTKLNKNTIHNLIIFFIFFEQLEIVKHVRFYLHALCV